MPTDHDSIVDALRAALARLDTLTVRDLARDIDQASITIRSTLTAVESLVAENARLREQIEVLQRAWEAEHALAMRGERKR